jgi:flagellar export protein FliJ
MAFRFRLDKVRDHRQRVVDQKSRDVGKAVRVVALINSRIQLVTDEMDALLTGQASAAGSLNVSRMNQRRIWLEHLDQQRNDLRGELNAASEELARRQTALTEAWRDLEVLKKLEERQKIAWQEEQLRRENQDLDEIGQIRADRRNRENLASGKAHPAGAADNLPPASP